jgi:hypothetical protein
MRLLAIKNAEKEAIAEYDERMQRLVERIDNQKITKGRTAEAQLPISQTPSQIGSSGEQQDELTAITESYQAQNSQILNKLEVSDADELIRTADDLERENFSLYNYVVENGAISAGLQEEVERLTKRRQELEEISEMTEEEQGVKLAQLTEQIESVKGDLAKTKDTYHKERTEFTEIYQKITELFKAIGCSWDGAPDEKTSVCDATAMFALSTIEKQIAHVMNEVFDQARSQIEAGGGEMRPAQGEEKTEISAGKSTAHLRNVAERELANRTQEATRPLTIEELRELL